MAIVTLHLQPDAVRSLSERAEQGGQSLETYLEQLVEEHIHAASSDNGNHEETDEEQLSERPWRGVFVPPRPRDVLFSEDLLKSRPIEKRQPSPNMNWHRAEASDE